MAQAIRYPTSANFVQKTLGAQLLAGATASATLNNATSIQNLPGVMIIDRVDTNNVETPTKREVIKFTATSGVTVTTLTRNADSSGTDQDHAVGAVVEFGPDVIWAQSLIDGLTEVVVAATGLLDTTKVVNLTTAQSLTNKTLTSPKIITDLSDTNGNELFKVTATASAVNEVTVTNAATGNAPSLSATGGDTNIDLTLAAKGSGKVKINSKYGDITSNTDGATVTFDLAVTNLHKVTLGGNRTLALSNPTTGQAFIIRLLQDATGSRTVTWFTTISWAGGTAPTLTLTASKADTLGFICTGSGTYDGFIVGQNI